MHDRHDVAPGPSGPQVVRGHWCLVAPVQGIRSRCRGSSRETGKSQRGRSCRPAASGRGRRRDGGGGSAVHVAFDAQAMAGLAATGASRRATAGWALSAAGAWVQCWHQSKGQHAWAQACCTPRCAALRPQRALHTWADAPHSDARLACVAPGAPAGAPAPAARPPAGAAAPVAAAAAAAAACACSPRVSLASSSSGSMEPFQGLKASPPWPAPAAAAPSSALRWLAVDRQRGAGQ